MLLTNCVSSLPPKTRVLLKPAVIVLDPGHGGNDSGALSPHGLKEKDIALDIALRARRLIKVIMPHAHIILTRESDKALSLKERITIANNAHADLFVSIHINSSDNKDVSGFEVYSLDTIRYSEKLAAKESEGVDFILADLRAYGHRRESDKLARHIAQNLKIQIKKHISHYDFYNRGFNQALFQVLLVNMPAVLAELFFISNAKDERLLSTAAMRECCARGIVAGLAQYLKENK